VSVCWVEGWCVYFGVDCVCFDCCCELVYLVVVVGDV